MKTIYELALNEKITINGIEIVRVPDGWSYTFPGKQPIFIKFNSEFEFVSSGKKISPQLVINSIGDYYNLPVRFITSKSKQGNIPIAKQMIVKVFDNYTKLSRKQMQKELHYKNHSSIIAALKTIDDLMEYDRDTENDYFKILRQLGLNN